MTNAYIVHNEEDVRQKYFYKKSTPPAADRFPCIMLQRDWDGGIMGDGYYYTFVYPPITMFGEYLDAWFAGFIEGTKYA